MKIITWVTFWLLCFCIGYQMNWNRMERALDYKIMKEAALREITQEIDGEVVRKFKYGMMLNLNKEFGLKTQEIEYPFGETDLYVVGYVREK